MLSRWFLRGVEYLKLQHGSLQEAGSSGSERRGLSSACSASFSWRLLPRSKTRRSLYRHLLRGRRWRCHTEQNDRHCSILPCGVRNSLENGRFLGHPCASQAWTTREKACFGGGWESYARILAVGRVQTVCSLVLSLQDWQVQIEDVHISVPF